MDERNGAGEGDAAGTECRTIRLRAIAILTGLALVILAMPLVTRAGARAPTATLLWQDLTLLPVFAVAILFFAPARPLPPGWRLPRRWWPAAMLALVAAGVAGHWLVFEGIDLSRDEQMASFDAAIFAGGHLAQPIPPAWRGVAPALNLLFILPIGDHAAWVSAYLPVNAAFRALVGTIADPVLTSPLLMAVGFAALAGIARRLWPASRGSQAAALLCYAGSSQIVVTGMTAYAMTAHLALNLVWLWPFLRGDRAGVAGTLVIGFLATGAHQPLFHPLFALPFLAGLLWQRRWRRVAVYALGYALIGGFWLAWPMWMSGLAGAVPVANDQEGIGYAARLALVLADIDVAAVWTMAVNLVRFLTWQHLLLLPLALLGLREWRRAPLVRPLAIGLALPIVVMGLILPWQGHGWGYRYLHPVLGNACLLAGYGWQRAEAMRADLARPMLAATLASVLVLLPVHGWMAHELVMALAVPEQAIARTSADIAVIDAAPFSIDLVRNAPDLANRPLRLDSGKLEGADLARLCRGRRVAFVDAPQLNTLNRRYYEPPATGPTRHQRMLRTAAQAAGCTIVSG